MKDYNGYFPFIKIIKSKKKKLGLTLFHCLGQETKLDDLFLHVISVHIIVPWKGKRWKVVSKMTFRLPSEEK